MKTAVAVAIALLVFFAFGREWIWHRIAGPADLGRYDFGAGQRRTTPNDALACSPGTCENPDIEVRPVTKAPAAAIDGLARRLADIEPRHRRVDDRTDPAYARFVVFSWLMRYPDTVDIEAVPLAGEKTGLRVYSRSQLGRSDLGVNARRLRRLFAAE